MSLSHDAKTEAKLARLLKQNSRYPREAYLFLFAGLVRAQQNRTEKPSGAGADHVRGPELCEALRELALDEFGPLALRVLREWNILRTDDFGRIVFNLIEAGLLSSTAEDSLVDFADGYEFTTAFVEPFAETGDLPTDLPPLV